MAPAFREIFALVDTNVPFLIKALDCENFAVIDAAAFGLAFELRFTVFRDADAVALGNADFTGAEDVEAVCLLERERRTRTVGFLKVEPVIVLSNYVLFPARETLGVLVELHHHAGLVIADVALLRIRPPGRFPRDEFVFLPERAALL